MNIPKKKYKDIADVLKVVAHPDRLKIIEILKSKEMIVSDIKEELNIKQSIVSQHLNNMKSKNILRARREGNYVYYSILNREILNIIDCIKRCSA